MMEKSKKYLSDSGNLNMNNRLVFLLSTSLLLSSCFTNSENYNDSSCIENDWAEMGLKGRVKHLEYHWHTDLDSTEEGWLYIYDFDSIGFIHHSSFWIDGELVREVYFERNKRKEIIHAAVIDHQNDLEYKMYYTYSNCKVIDITGFKPDEANRWDQRKLIYDSLGRVVKTVELLDGNIQSTEITLYGENGSYELKQYDHDNYLRYRYVKRVEPNTNRYYSSNNNYWGEDDTNSLEDFTLTYWDTNKFGNKIFTGNYVGDKLYTRQFNYNYDSLGNWIRYDDYQDSVLWHYYTRKIEYY